MNKKRWLQLLKLIGIILFLWILSRIDRQALFTHLQNAHWMGIFIAFAGLFLMYLCKAARWHLLVLSTGLKPSFMDSWRLFHIGIFLGAITPANTGEMGRAAYLRRLGLHTGTALALPIIDRITDMVVMGIVGIWSVGFLFGWTWSLFSTLFGILGTLCLLFLWKKSQGLRQKEWLTFLKFLTHPRMFTLVFVWSILSWLVYFIWTFILARAVGLQVSLPILIAAFTLTGIIVLIPISPSGLGTREAVLIMLLAPYAVAPPQAVAFSLLLFFLVILSSTVGLWYWLYPKKTS